jgi:hypothetical protein
LTGTLTVGDTSTSATVATIKSSNASGTYIQFVNGTTPTVEVGYNATYGAYLYNDKLDSHPTLCLGLADNLRDAIIYKYAGVNYNVWHSGSLKPYQFTNWADTRSVNHVPNDYGSLFIMRGIKNLTTIGLSDSGVYATVWGWRGWLDKSGGHAWEIASTNNDLYTRHGETTSWTSWAKILNSSNYKDYMHDRFGTSGLIVYPSLSNEINFGGTYTANSNIYFGYNSKDNRPKPTNYYFGNSDATVHAKSFIAYASSGPHFYGRADANNWAYIRLYSGTIFGDIAVTTNSSASSTAGAIELRPSGTESKKGGVTGEGYLFTQSSGYLTTIGSTNISYCHFYTTAPEYYFNKTTVVNGNITPYVNANFDLGRTDYYWNRVYANAFISKIATGTQPFQCVSTTTCTNLNADLLDGFHGSAESTANTYVRRNQSKYIRVNYINSDTAKNENHDFTQIITTDDGDNYYRKAGIRFFMKRLNSYTKIIDLKSLDANKYYPISFQLVQRKSFIRIKIWNCLDGNKPTWATHTNGFAAAIEWDTTANVWGSQDTQRIIYADNYKYCDKSPCGGIEQNTMASVEIVYLRGGAIYYYNNNDNIEAIINSNGYSWTKSTLSYSAPVINNIKNRAYSCYNLSLRSFSTLYCSEIISYSLNISSTSTFGGKATFNGGLSGTLTGSLSGNATTATTLQTSRTINGTSFNGSANITTSYWGTTRTIWGQSVNGSANVSGAMTGVTSITATGLIRTSNLFSAGDGGSDNAYGYYNCTRPNTADTGYVCYAMVRRGTYAFGIGYYNSEIVLGSANTSRQFSAKWLQIGSARLLINGNIEATGAVTAKSSSSDIRLKKNIKEYNALAIIHKLKSVKYYWNDTAKANSPIFNDNEEHYGLIAQDLLINGYSQWVSNCFKDYYVIQYERLIPVLWRGIQQVDNEVATLKKKIATLEKELSSVKRQLSL